MQPGRWFWQTEALWWPGASVVSSSLGRWRPFWQRWCLTMGPRLGVAFWVGESSMGCTQQYLTIKNKASELYYFHKEDERCRM